MLVLLWAVPAAASAAEIVVNRTTDGLPVSGEPCTGAEECTLREAINLANVKPGADTISFAGISAPAVLEVDEAPLPEINEQVTINGDTAVGATAGVPAVELKPTGFDSLEGVAALSVDDGTETKIEGLAIGGFGIGIRVGPTESGHPSKTKICHDYVGTDLSGDVAAPNDVGIEVQSGVASSEQPRETTIGGTGCENVIAGNSVRGIVDQGLETTIADNRIGFGAEGSALANGTSGNTESAGVFVSGLATGTLIGGVNSGSEGQNLIWFNAGPGVLVEKGASLVTVRHNSFFHNEGKGIEIKEGAPAAPVITSAASPSAREILFKGTIEGTPGEQVTLEFFGSKNCEKAGEGQTFLGTATEEVRAGPTEFTAEGPIEVPADERGITATATHANGATSEFSACAEDQRVYVVNTREESTESGECLTVTKCSLRGAIEAANETAVMDTIDFGEGAEGAISAFTQFKIEHPVRIDGSSAPHYVSKPVVEVDGPGPTTLGFYLTPEAAGSTISDLAIGDFSTGVALEGNDQRVCGSYLGLKSDGSTAVPNEVGVEVAPGTVGDQIGAGCEGSGGGNVISGNTHFGVIDFGSEAQIAGNLIGIDAGGSARANGEIGGEGAGIALEPLSSATTIGPVSPEAANVVAHNNGPGVLVQRGPNKAKIRGNSIYANEREGIEIVEEAPTAPLVSKVVKNSDTMTIEGEVTTAGAETVELDFFASSACIVLARGGQTYLGSDDVSAAAGTHSFSTEVANTLPAGEEYVTATATGSVDGQTSEFSECFLYQAPEPGSRTFTVNTLADGLGAAGCEEATECTLRGAIEAANKTVAADTIDFAGSAEGAIRIAGFPLPQITEPVHIDGTSAPGYTAAGGPVVELEGTEATNEGPVYGLEVFAEGTVVEGLAIGGFQTAGIHLGGEGVSSVCADWIGVGLGGTNLPNGDGVEVERDSIENEVGVGCAAGAPDNVISANELWGIQDNGRQTQIGGNEVGISPAGAPDGNGEGGIHETAVSFIPRIGTGGPAEGAPNEIAYNHGPGVRVESGLERAQIRTNSIYGNAGKGIEIGEERPATPTISSVTGASGALSVSGAVSVGDDEHVELDFYASAVCSPLSAGVGETYLGTKTLDVTPVSTSPYTESITTPISDDELYITVTATGEGTGQTTEFSECVQRPAPPPEKHEEPHSEVTPPGPGPVTDLVIPKNGEKVVVQPEEGKVRIKLPGSNKYVPLTELKEIPVGAVIDATNGRVKLVSIGPEGTEQTAEFFGGVFRVKQKEGSGLVVLELLDTNACTASKPKGGKSGKGGGSPRAMSSSVSARPKGGTAGKLWGSGHGNFRTEGHAGSATVEGTIWLVEDRCNGSTFFRTRSGIVKVRDFIKHKSLPLPAGKTYLAGG